MKTSKCVKKTFSLLFLSQLFDIFVSSPYNYFYDSTLLNQDIKKTNLFTNISQPTQADFVLIFLKRAVGLNTKLDLINGSEFNSKTTILPSRFICWFVVFFWRSVYGNKIVIYIVKRSTPAILYHDESWHVGWLCFLPYPTIYMQIFQRIMKT